MMHDLGHAPTLSRDLGQDHPGLQPVPPPVDMYLYSVALLPAAQVSGSLLEAMFSRWDGNLERDAEGRVFLEFNPVCFRALHNALARDSQRPGSNAVLSLYAHSAAAQHPCHGHRQDLLHMVRPRGRAEGAKARSTNRGLLGVSLLLLGATGVRVRCLARQVTARVMLPCVAAQLEYLVLPFIPPLRLRASPSTSELVVDRSGKRVTHSSRIPAGWHIANRATRQTWPQWALSQQPLPALECSWQVRIQNLPVLHTASKRPVCLSASCSAPAAHSRSLPRPRTATAGALAG